MRGSPNNPLCCRVLERDTIISSSLQIDHPCFLDPKIHDISHSLLLQLHRRGISVGSKPGSQPWPHVILFISNHPHLSVLTTQCKKSKNAIKFLIHLLCPEEKNLQVAWGHSHSLSLSTPEEELDHVHHHVTLNKSRWLSDKHSHVSTLYFPGNTDTSSSIQFSRCKKCPAEKKNHNSLCIHSLSPSLSL